MREKKYFWRGESGWAVHLPVCSTFPWSQWPLIRGENMHSHFNSHGVTLRPSYCQPLKSLMETCLVCVYKSDLFCQDPPSPQDDAGSPGDLKRVKEQHGRETKFSGEDGTLPGENYFLIKPHPCKAALKKKCSCRPKSRQIYNVEIKFKF